MKWLRENFPPLRVWVVLILAASLMALVTPTPKVRAQQPVNTTTISTFQFTVTAATNPAQLGTTTGATVTGTQPGFVKQITIQPLQANTSGQVQIMSASGAANTGYQLLAGQALVIPVMGSLTSIWIRVGTGGDGVSCICWSD